MALTERNSDGKKYLRIADYSICEKYSTEQEGWEVLKTTDRNGKEYTSWVKRYKSVDGYITGIEYVKRTLPGTTTEVKSWEISMQDGNERYQLQIPATSPAASRFVKLAENIDPTQKVEFSAWKDTSGAEPKLAFMVKQNGANIPQKYSIKEVEVKNEKGKTEKVTVLVDYANPDDITNMPRLRVSKSGDKNWSDVEDFLFERMDTVVRPRFTADNVVEDDEVETSSGTEEDEIPF